MIEGHGDDIYRYGDKIRYNFSSNIPQGINHQGLKAYLTSRLDVISNYPEPAPYTVESLLAQHLGISSENVMVTNGAAEAIYTIAQSYHGQRSTVLQPTFAEYADAARAARHRVSSISDLSQLAGCKEDKMTGESLVWLCNPNNPTGAVHNPEDLITQVKTHPQVTFIIDQAYHQYTTKPTINPTEILRHDNLILLYSLTKDYAIPGLRLGYAVANSRLIERFKRIRIPWSVNAVAIEAAKYLIGGRSLKTDEVDLLLKERTRMASKFEAMGIYVYPSETNYMLCRLPKGTAHELKQYLVQNKGILIRDASNFEGLTDRHFRVAAQTKIENDLLINALQEWILS